MFEFLKECDFFNIYLRASDCEIKAAAYDCVTPIAVFFEVVFKAIYAYFIPIEYGTPDMNLFGLLKNEPLISLVRKKYGFEDFTTVDIIRRKSNSLKHDSNAVSISSEEKERYFKCLFSFCSLFFTAYTKKQKPKWSEADYQRMLQSREGGDGVATREQQYTERIQTLTELLQKASQSNADAQSTIYRLEADLQMAKERIERNEFSGKTQINRLQEQLEQAFVLRQDAESRLHALEKRMEREQNSQSVNANQIERVSSGFTEPKLLVPMSEIVLSANQKKAVECTDKYIAVVAGPGSGKTRVLTERIQHLVCEGKVLESKILALTFSAKAANEVRKRLKERLGIRACKIEVKTFHSFGLGMIRQHAELLGFKGEVEIADSTMRFRILRKLLEKQSVYRSELTLADIQSYAQTISSIKGGVAVEDQRIRQLCNAYNAELRKGNYIDFDDMVALARELLIRFPDVRASYKQRYDHVLIDEIQDVNAWQVSVLRGITGPNTMLFIVGDDDQCIYEWRGAMPSYLKGFAENNAFTVIRLEENYRSEMSIVNASALFISRNSNRIHKHILGQKKKREGVPSSMSAYWLANEQMEADFIARKIRTLVERENYSYSDITVLLRQHKQFEAIRNAFERNQIPCNCQTDSSLYNGFIPVLSAVAYPDRKGSISRAVNYPNRIMDNFLYQDLIAKYHLPKEMTVPQVFDYLVSINDNFEECDTFRQRYLLIKELHEKARYLTVCEIIKRLSDHYEAEAGGESRDAILNLKAMSTLAKDFDDGYTGAHGNRAAIEVFLDFVRLSEEDASGREESEHAVNLMTCHQSKGLEWPIVFIPGVQCGIFPDSKHIRSRGDIEAERRLLYVSMTRAINKLYITANDDPYRGERVADNHGHVLFSYQGFMADIPGLILHDME